MISTEIANASKIMIGSTLASAMYIGSEKLWPVELYEPVMDIPHYYSLNYFTIESLEDSNTIRIEKNGNAPNILLSYSTDNGTTWTDLTVSASIDLTTIDIGDKIIFKGTNRTLSSKYNAYWRFAPSKNFNVCGNAMSLLFGDNFINNSEFSSGTKLQLNGLFYNTATLINAKNLILPATTLTNRSYYRMFQNCTSLITAPELPATTLADYCYYAMFYGCTSLVTAPELPATTLADHCYYAMFGGCTLLNHVKALFTTDISLESNYTNSWLNGVAATGTFIKNKNATWSRTGASGIPSGWTVELYEDVMHDYSLDYFTIESLENNNTITASKVSSSINPVIYYSLDDGETWSNLTLSSGTITFGTINTGEKIIFKSETALWAVAWNSYNKFSGTKNFKIYGNIMSLINGNNFVSNPSFAGASSFNLCGLFYGTTTLIDAKNLILPATTLKTSSYNGMFRGCTNLIYGPKILPALNIPHDGYSSMFEGCTSLVEAPEILATTVSGDTALTRMFCMNRSSKVTAAMTKSPILRITNPSSYNNVYQLLFAGNGNITEVTILAQGTNLSFANWLANTNTSGGVIRKLSTTTLTSGGNGVPSNWTTETYTQS